MIPSVSYLFLIFNLDQRVVMGWGTHDSVSYLFLIFNLDLGW